MISPWNEWWYINIYFVNQAYKNVKSLIQIHHPLIIIKLVREQICSTHSQEKDRRILSLNGGIKLEHENVIISQDYSRICKHGAIMCYLFQIILHNSGVEYNLGICQFNISQHFHGLCVQTLKPKDQISEDQVSNINSNIYIGYFKIYIEHVHIFQKNTKRLSSVQTLQYVLQL